MSTYPSLHVNVAVEPCVVPLLKTGALPFTGALSDEHDAVGAALGIEVGAELGFDVGALVGDKVKQVGAVCAVHSTPTLTPSSTLHFSGLGDGALSVRCASQ